MHTRCTMLLHVFVALSVLLLGLAGPAQASRPGMAMAEPAPAGLAAPAWQVFDPTQMYVDDDWAGLPPGTIVYFPGDPYSHTVGIDAFAAIQDGVDGLVLTGTVHVADGIYTGTIDIVSRSDIQVVGLDRDLVTVRPDDTLCWDVGGYGCGRHTAVRVVDSTGIAFADQTWDWVDVSGNNVSGFLYWDSSGTLDHNMLKNMSRPDAGGYYYELTSYLRAPSYTDTARAEIILQDNIFSDTGRLGLVSHDFVHLEIEGNTFAKDVDDFGYAMEIGSRSTAVISGNVIYGFDTPAASDGSVSAGIYVENSFTAGLPHITKTVMICNNDIYGNQYGLFLGNEFVGYAGDIDIVATLQDNAIHDNLLGGFYVVDEGRSAGSSVTLHAAGNWVTNNGDVGCYLNTYGNGELHVFLAQNAIREHDAAGILVENWGGSGSLYDLDAHHNRIVDNTWGLSNTSSAAFPAFDNWWGCNEGPGSPGCDPIFDASYDPWLVLGLEVTPTLVLPAGSAELTADLTWNSFPTDTLPWGHIPDGTPVEFAATLGAAVPTATVTSGGMSAATFEAGMLPGIAVVSTTVDHQVVTATVTIVEPVVQWSSSVYGVDEAAPWATLTATLSGPSALTVTVDYATLAGTAVPGEDYVAVSGTLSFGPGQEMVTLSVPLLDDVWDEPDETLFVPLTNPVNAELGAPVTATVTILDDEVVPLVQFDRAAYAADEGALWATLTATLSGPSALTVTVDYATLAGTAAPGEDYVAVSGTLSFAPGQEMLTLSVPLLDDVWDEPDETLFVPLTNPVNAELGTPVTATVTLLDDEATPLVQFDRSAYAADEGAPWATLTVTLSGPSALTVTVDYATLAGTAVPGEDYIAVSGTLSFAPGQQVLTFSVPLLDDAVEEPNETLFVSLTNPINAELGAPVTATVTILDDDVGYRLYLPLIVK